MHRCNDDCETELVVRQGSLCQITYLIVVYNIECLLPLFSLWHLCILDIVVLCSTEWDGLVRCYDGCETWIYCLLLLISKLILFLHTNNNIIYSYKICNCLSTSILLSSPILMKNSLFIRYM